MPSIVALIPARAGSKRIPGKNTKLLAGHPLIAYTIAAAQESGIFARICVCSDAYLDGLDLGGGFGFVLRPPSEDYEPDFDWVRFVLAKYNRYDSFAILRPTSPFRTADTIHRAWAVFQDNQPCDSIRAISPVTQHPLKMWKAGYAHGEMKPLLSAWAWPDNVQEHSGNPPFHSRPTQTLPPVYIQNASLEIAWACTVWNRGSISGDRVMPFITEGYEGFDLNTPDDWARAEQIAAAHPELLPRIQTTV